MHKSKKVLTKLPILLVLMASVLLGHSLLFPQKVQAAIPTTINFQGKVVNSNGTNVTDGTYSFVFQLYNSGAANPNADTCTNQASCLWEETQGSVTVTSGVFQVELGTSCSFFTPASCNKSTAIDFTTNSLYLTMKFNSDAQGFMTPLIHFQSVPYAFNSERLGGIQASGFVQLQGSTPGTPQTGHFNISGTGIAATLQAATFDTASGVALNIGTNNATVINLNEDTVVAASKYLKITGAATGSRPGSPTAGTLFYDTTTNQLLQYNGTKWVSDRAAVTKIVAASNSSQAAKDAADYVADNSDDQYEINAALTAAAGGKVYLMEGTYSVGNNGDGIYIPNNTILAGAGRGTIIQMETLTSGRSMISNSDGTTGTGVVIRDLRLDGRTDLNPTYTESGISLGAMGGGSGATYRPGATVENIWIEDFLNYGIHLSNSDHNTIKNNHIDLEGISSAYGIFLDDSTYNNITSNSIHDTDLGIYLFSPSADNNMVTNNTIVGGASSSDIGIADESLYNAVSNNTISSQNIGLWINFAQRGKYTSNLLQSNTSSIRIEDGSYSLISNNTIRDSGGSTANDGILFTSASSYNQIVHNYITDSACTSSCNAIYITSDSQVKNYFEGNRFSGSASDAAVISDGGLNSIYVNQSMKSTTSTNSDVTDFLLRGSLNSSTAYQIQNTIGSSAFLIDTTPLNSNLSNSSIELEEVGGDWTYSGASGGSVIQSTAQKYIGNASLSVTTGSTAAAFDGVKGAIDNTLSASTTYYISWYDRITSGTFTDVIARFSYDGTVGNQSSCTSINTQVVSTAGWTRHTCQFTTGSGGTAPTASNAIFIVQNGNNGGTQRTFYVDAVQLETTGVTAYKEMGIALNGLISSPVAVKSVSNSTTAFQVQNTTGNEILTIDTTGDQVVFGRSGSGGVTGKITFKNSTNSNTASIQSGTTSTSYTLTLPTALPASLECLKADNTGAASFGSCGTGGGGTLAASYAAGTSSTDQTILLTAADGNGILIQDASSTVGTLFAVQEFAGASNYLQVTASAVTFQNSSAVNVAVIDLSGHNLKVYDSTGANYAIISATTTDATFASNTGTTRIGNGSGNISFNMTDEAHLESHTHSDTSVGANYSSSDFTFTRDLDAISTFNLQGNVMRIEDLSTVTSGTSTPNVLYVNQNNTSATGNLILAQTGGSTTRFSVNTAGDVDISGVYKKGGTSGTSNTCSGGQVLQNQVTSGGITTGGSCATVTETLQLAYDAGNTITTTDNRDISVTLANTTTDSNFKINIASGSTSQFKIQNNGSDVLSVNTTSVEVGALADSTPHTFESGCACLTNSAAGTFGGESAIDGAVSSSVFQGELYVATAETDNAAVYRYDGGTTWTKVTDSTAGKIISGDNDNIDKIVLAIYNGKLFAGTQTGASASPNGQQGALYHYDGSSWTLVNATRGTFGSQSAIDGVSDLVVWNGQLYLASQKANAAVAYKYDGFQTFTQITFGPGEVLTADAVDADAYVMVSYGGRLWIGAITGSTTARVYRWDGTASTAWTLMHATRGTFGAQGSIPDVVSMAVADGQLFIGTGIANAANVYVYKGSLHQNAAAANTDWQATSATNGRLDTTNDATDIDSISSLRTYNGRLYAGTNSAGLAAVYEYIGTSTASANNWAIQNKTGGSADRGRFGAQTGVDSVETLIWFNGLMYVGTQDSGVGSIYSWSKNLDNSAALGFNVTSGARGFLSFVGGEQSQGNTNRQGKFIFSNSIALTSAAFDYAEDYPTLDSSLEPGEPVTVDPAYPEHVRRAVPGDEVLGVVSENPGLRLSSDAQPLSGASWTPIALVGRVPVKVTGDVSPGDNLMLSQTPGVLQKASEAAKIAGSALEGRSGEGISKISMYVNPGLHISESLLDRINNLSKQGTASQSGLEFLGASSDSPVRIDAGGNAFFSGTITANKIKANEIEGLEIYAEKISNIQNRIDQAAVTNANGTVVASSGINAPTSTLNLNVDGLLIVGKDAEFHGNALFYKLVTFIEKTVFKNDVTFARHITTSGEKPEVKTELAAGIKIDPEDEPDVPLASVEVNGNDISGELIIKTGKDSKAGELLTLEFKNEFESAPKVLLTASNSEASNLKFFVTSSKKDFKIHINDPLVAGIELKYNYWVVQ